MVSPDFDDSSAIDLDEDDLQDKTDLEQGGIDLDEEWAKEEGKPSWLETVGDVLTQAGRGGLKYFTWPADVIKAGMIGEGLSDLDEIEEIAQREGIPFDREEYIKGVFDTSQFIPTQDLLERGFEEATGLSLQPKTEFGKGAKQFAEIASFTPGTIARKVLGGGIAAGTTAAAKTSGVSEGKAELLGDIASLSPSVLEKAPRALTKAAQSAESTAKKFGLPFIELMAREKEPFVKGRLFSSTEKRLKDQFDLTADKAVQKIIKDELPISRLRDRGVNLDSLAEHAYQTTTKLAQANPRPIKTDFIVGNIDKEIDRIKRLAPSPSDAQKAAIKILENERDILKVSNPTSEQIINQHKNYNADLKSIYRKPEFSGKEEEVRKSYEFLKDQILTAVKDQGQKDVANAFKASNKIYHEKSKLDQTERILEKAFNGQSYDPKKLTKTLNSRDGKFLRRNMSKQGIKDLEEIANFGEQAQAKMNNFIDLNNNAVANEIKQWGQLGWAVFMPHSLKSAALTFARPVAKHIQGKLLTRPATRQIYKVTLKHAAEGSFQLLKKDFADLQREVEKEFGTIDDFIDDSMEELELDED